MHYLITASTSCMDGCLRVYISLAAAWFRLPMDQATLVARSSAHLHSQTAEFVHLKK